MPHWLLELSPVEWLAAIAMFFSVWLATKADIRNFPIGIFGVLLYGWVFWQNKLYANAVLMVGYHFPMRAVGWWLWLRGGPQQKDDLPIGRMSPQANFAWATGALACTVVWGYFLSAHTDGAAPYWDAATTACSLIAQYLLTRKRIENWLYWIAANLIYVFVLFPGQQLYVSVVLYAVLIGVCTRGFFQWNRAARVGAAQV